MPQEQIQKLLYPELSYLIRGILFRVQNELGKGYREKHIQRAVAAALKKEGIKCQEQVKAVFEFDGRAVGIYFLDFVIDGKIVVELKVCERPSQQHFNQVKQYLAKTRLPLGLLACFGKESVKVYRVLRPA